MIVSDASVTECVTVSVVKTAGVRAAALFAISCILLYKLYRSGNRLISRSTKATNMIVKIRVADSIMKLCIEIVGGGCGDGL